MDDVEQPGHDDPEPFPSGQADVGGVEKRIDQGRERQEDDAKERQQEPVKGCVDPGRRGPASPGANVIALRPDEGRPIPGSTRSPDELTSIR
jgi:hypothetical protein